MLNYFNRYLEHFYKNSQKIPKDCVDLFNEIIKELMGEQEWVESMMNIY